MKLFTIKYNRIPNGNESDASQHMRPYIARFVMDAEDALEAMDERRKHRTVRLPDKIVVLRSFPHFRIKSSQT